MTATAARPITLCAHCGLALGGDRRGSDVVQFCCAGCETAYDLLQEHGLAHYYAFAERRGTPIANDGRSFDAFDHPTFHDLYVTRLAGGYARVELLLEGVHCASCVWLIERAPLLVPGVARAELEVRRALATVEFEPSVTPLSVIARSLSAIGYRPHPYRGVAREAVRRQEDRAMLVRIGVAGAIAMNVMLAALALYAGWFGGMDAEYARYFRWVSLLVTLPAIWWPARPFFVSALAALRTRTLNIDVPIATALGAGFVRGAINTITDRGPIYFDGVALLIFLLLVGRYLQQRGQRVAADAAELLYGLTPNIARVVDAALEIDSVREMPTEALVPGMVLEVRPGETLGADAIVRRGTSALDISWLTGEPKPRQVTVGDHVFAGTTNLTSTIRVEVTDAGETSRLARIVRQVQEQASRRAPMVLLADRLSGLFVAAVMVLALSVFAIASWRGAADATDRAIALLIVTCPCALALATPLSFTAAVGRAATSGILIKGADVLETLAAPGLLLLDKTGTITNGRTTLSQWDGEEWVRPLVLAVEAESVHPIAEGFRRAWPNEVVPRASAVRHIPGNGVEGMVNGRRVRVGSQAFVSAELRSDIMRAASSRHTGAGTSAPRPCGASPGTTAPRAAHDLTPVAVGVDGAIVAHAFFRDTLRPGARDAIATLQSRGWTVGILSGDAPDAVRAVAREVGIPEAMATGGATPEGKLEAVRTALGRGPVVMAGDGLNDAAAIAAATVGVGVHGGAEACLAAADVYLSAEGLAPLVALTDGAARTMRIVRRNLALSLAYNAIGLTLAVTGVINPLIAAIMMPVSSVTVVIVAWLGDTFPAPTTRRADAFGGSAR